MTKGDEMRRETGSLGATPEEVIDSLREDREYFKQRYAAKLEDERKALEAVAQLERTNAALLEALKHAVAHLETMAKPTEEYMHHFCAAIAEATQ